MCEIHVKLANPAQDSAKGLYPNFHMLALTLWQAHAIVKLQVDPRRRWDRKKKGKKKRDIGENETKNSEYCIAALL